MTAPTAGQRPWPPRPATEGPKQRTQPLPAASGPRGTHPAGPRVEIPEVVWSRPAVIPLVARAHQGRRAGVVSRVLSAIVDSVVVLALLLLAYLGLVAMRFMVSPQTFSFPSLSLVFAVAGFLSVLVVYLTVSWATTGRSYGDQVLGLRVVNFRGHRMRWAGAFVRALACALFPIGLLWVVVSRENRSLQDVVLRTSVIYDWRDFLSAPESHSRDK